MCRFQLESIWKATVVRNLAIDGVIDFCPCVYHPIYFFSNWSCSKVHLNIDVGMNSSFGPQFLLMKSTNSSQSLTSVYEAWICLRARTKSLPFDTQWIIIVNVVFGNFGRLLLAHLPVLYPKFVACCLLFRLTLFLASRILLAHYFITI